MRYKILLFYRSIGSSRSPSTVNEELLCWSTVDNETDKMAINPSKRYKKDINLVQNAAQDQHTVCRLPSFRSTFLKTDDLSTINLSSLSEDEDSSIPNEKVFLILDDSSKNNEITPPSYSNKTLTDVFDGKASEHELASLIFKEAEILLQVMIGRSREWYMKQFIRAKDLSDDFMGSKCKISSLENFDVSLLERKILSLFFEASPYEGEYLTVLSERKFNDFLSFNMYRLFSYLDVGEVLNSKMLCVIEFIKIRNYYQELPELLFLERIRVNPNSLIYKFYYLRSLNVVLEHFRKHNVALSTFKDSLLLFLQKIIISLTPMKKWDINVVRKMSVVMNSCGKKHTNLFYIFLYNIENDSRRNIISRCYERVIIGKFNLSLSIKIVCLSFLYKNLVLNFLLDRHYYGNEKIADFVKFLKYHYGCINCMMSKCVDLLGNQEMCLNESY